jgi:hypothetical protein
MLCLPRSISDELLDPFMTYPPTTELGADALLKYCKISSVCPLNVPANLSLSSDSILADFTTAVYRTFPWQAPSNINPTITYYTPLIYTDRVLFHTILQHAAVQLEILGHTGARTLSQRLMGDCLRLLQERIRDPDHAVSNETLAAVANLAAIEVKQGHRCVGLHCSLTLVVSIGEEM